MTTYLVVGCNRAARSACRRLLVSNIGQPQTSLPVGTAVGNGTPSISYLVDDRPCFYFSTWSSSSAKVGSAQARDDEGDDDYYLYQTKSKRRQFKETPVHPSIRRYVEMIGVGIPNRRKGTKRLRNHLFDHIEEGRRTNRNRGPGSQIKPPPPFSTSNDPQGGRGGGGEQQQRQSRVVVIGSVSTTEDTFPTNKEFVPEVALAGRSNVGKSTLLNALLYGNQIRRIKSDDGEDAGKGKNNNNHSNLVRRHNRKGTTPENVKLPKGIKAVVSPKPGETQKITFYQLGSSDNNKKNHNLQEEDDDDEVLMSNNNNSDKKTTKNKKRSSSIAKNPNHKLRLVDLPGYGFSFSPRNHDGFQELLLQYLLERGKALKRVLLLIDARHGFKKADFEFLQTMEMESYKSSKRKMPAIQIVLTKCDLVRRDDLARRVVHVRQELSDTLRRETSSLPVLLVSARAGVGYNNVKNKRNGSARARGGVLELQKELAALVPHQKKNRTTS